MSSEKRGVHVTITHDTLVLTVQGTPYTKPHTPPSRHAGAPPKSPYKWHLVAKNGDLFQMYSLENAPLITSAHTG